MSFHQILVFTLGCVANLAVVAALLVFFLQRRSERSPFSVAGTGLAGVLLIMGLAWAGYLAERAMVVEAMAGVKSSNAFALYSLGLAECATSVTLGLWLSLFPALAGAGFLVWGLFSHPPRGAGRVAAAICLTAGIGLALVAVGDYLRFDDFFGFLMLLG